MDDAMISELFFAGFRPRSDEGWILDGYPRTVAQARLLHHHLQERQCPPGLALVLDVPGDSIRSRIQNRWFHSASGRSYSPLFNPPRQPGLDDVTGEPLIQRLDDNLDCWERRHALYEQNRPLLTRFYQDTGACHVISGIDSALLYSKIHSILLTVQQKTMKARN